MTHDENKMREYLSDAIKNIDKLRNNFIDANNKANAVEGIMILEMIKKTAQLENEIKNFKTAYEIDHKD